MKSRTDDEMIRAYDVLVGRLQQANIHPKKHILDNEISINMKQHIRDTYKFTIELVPPGNHHRNAAEVAIRNFKAHFLSILAGTADSFPLNLWDRLLPQTEITLNLLRQSNATPTVSAYAHLTGPFDYNKMPLAPLGCEVQIHEKTDKRGTWAYHCVDGWYLFTSPEHYRVHNCHVKATKKERLTDTIQFKHKHITSPSLSPQDKLMNAIANCKAALLGATHEQSNHELNELKTIVNNIETKVREEPKQSTEPLPRVQTRPTQASSSSNDQAVPRVQTEIIRLTRSVARQRAKQRRRRNSLAHLTAPVHLPSKPPALSTRSKVRAATANAPTKSTRVSRLHQPTASS